MPPPPMHPTGAPPMLPPGMMLPPMGFAPFSPDMNRESIMSYESMPPPQFLQSPGFNGPVMTDSRVLSQPGQSIVPIGMMQTESSDNQTYPTGGFRHRFGSASLNRSGSRGTAFSLSRQKSLIRPERTVMPENLLSPKPQRSCSPWCCFVYGSTCCCLPVCLSRCGGMHDPNKQRAWREKVALCWIVFILSGILAALAFGLQTAFCVPEANTFTYKQVAAFNQNINPHYYVIHGIVYDMSTYIRTHNAFFPILGTPLGDLIATQTGIDISPLFPSSLSQNCASLLQGKFTLTCSTTVFSASPHCHTSSEVNRVLKIIRAGPVTYDWNDLPNTGKNVIVYSGFVINVDQYLALNSSIFGVTADTIIRKNLGKDATKDFAFTDNLDVASCLASLFSIGQVSSQSVGCWAQSIILYIAVIVVGGLVFIRFALAVTFSWFISHQLGKLKKGDQRSEKDRKLSRRTEIEAGRLPITMSLRDGALAIAQRSKEAFATLTRRDSFESTVINDTESALEGPDPRSNLESVGMESELGSTLGTDMTPAVNPVQQQPMSALQTRETLRRRKTMGRKLTRPAISDYGKELHTILFVTCYSEDEQNLRTTLDSLAMTDYSEDNKLLFIVADGLIKGSGNNKTTPQMIIDMLELDNNWGEPEALSYIAIGEGKRAHNRAKAYVGWYTIKDRVVPTLLVVKCGTEEEANTPKPGNRGKRDSQMILMRFFQSVNFDNQMSPLEYDMFQKLHYLMGITPDVFEAVLMVDADTKVAPDSLSRMVACLVRDPKIMGLCGETRIANKTGSWVTRIQVFEYFISHHLAKAFESMFGGVTCLPGCFCMYRIKTPKDDAWVPVLCNPEVIQTYSESTVDTLHLKNLLLLGEDRFLTTLMLRTFPKRKLIFVPRAYCKTTVPETFKVLLSQRRRWINSTIHNLMELVRVRNLCGVFCCSMQFVVFLELISTALLPASIVFTAVLIVEAGFGIPVPPLEILFMLLIIGLPALLILFTVRHIQYIYWMFIYILALPIWSFVLPLYAFWHFDDFSWGETRVVDGDAKGKEGPEDVDSNSILAVDAIPMRRWIEWEFDRRRTLMQKWVMSHPDPHVRQQLIRKIQDAHGQKQ